MPRFGAWRNTTRSPGAVSRALDHGEEDLTELDRGLAGAVLDDAATPRLMTIPGVDFAVAVGILAAIGDVARFRSAQKR
jgi:transposase